MRRDNTSTKHHLNENFKPRFRPAAWFWIVVLVGLAVRIYLVVFTEGTYDVEIWQKHADGVRKYGLVEYYHINEEMNHPPFIGIIAPKVLSLSQLSHIPFRMLWRIPFVLADVGILILLLRLLRENKHRFIIAAAYWLNPLSIIFSGYHGNTDLSVAFFILLCVYLLSRQKFILAAIILGVSTWVKLPGILAVPALVFFIPDWRNRFIFICVVGLTGIFTYLPVLLMDPTIVCKNVLGYGGQIIQTTGGVPVWGTQIFLAHIGSLSAQWQKVLLPPALLYLRYNMWFCIAMILLLCWLRRYRKTVPQLGLTITGVYAIIYGFSNFWSFQYLAWSIPFWFFAPVSFAVPATILAGGYIYSLYWLLCGNPWLLGTWDFVGHPYWPKYVVLFRNGALLFFLISACVFLIGGICGQANRRFDREMQTDFNK